MLLNFVKSKFSNPEDRNIIKSREINFSQEDGIIKFVIDWYSGVYVMSKGSAEIFWDL